MADHDGMTVSGGIDGVTARLDDLVRLGAVLRAAGAEFGRHAAAVGVLAADPRLGVTSALSPGTFAAAEAALGVAALGPGGLLVLAARAEALGVSLQMAAAAYRGADVAVARGMQLAEMLVGQAAVNIAPAVVGPLVLPSAVWLGARVAAGHQADRGEDSPTDRSRRGPADRGGGGPADRTGGSGISAALLGTAGSGLDLLIDHPGLMDRIVPAVPGTVSRIAALVPGRGLASEALFGTPAGPATIPGLARGLGTLTGWAARTPHDQPAFSDPGQVSVDAVRVGWQRPPADLGELLGRIPASTASRPMVHVERLDGEDGRRRWVVAIPGTADWSPVPGRTPFDLTGNLRLMSGSRSSGLASVVAAMRSAGVRKGEPVLLVGHSQGGLIAAAAAADPAVRREFTVNRVLTAGAPIASVHVPHDVQVLSLEHTDDPVPRLDGSANPDRPDWVTVTAAAPKPARVPPPGPMAAIAEARRGPEPFSAHALSEYRQTAERVAGSDDPSLVAWRTGLAPFVGPCQDGAAWDIVINRVATS